LLYVGFGLAVAAAILGGVAGCLIRNKPLAGLCGALLGGLAAGACVLWYGEHSPTLFWLAFGAVTGAISAVKTAHELTAGTSGAEE
jgi:hypothetical protein